MMLLLILLTFLYAGVLLFLLYGYFQVPTFCGKNIAPKSTFSIVIPFRNEAENLPKLFASLLKLEYPKQLFEILLVNDASEDISEKLCLGFQEENQGLAIKILQNIRKTGSPKKDAIVTAISAAQYEFILTADADCEVPPHWLREFNGCIDEAGAQVIAGPVQVLPKNHSKMSFLDSFQEMDFLSLQVATIGGFGVELPFMCNGANFCYQKSAFEKVNGFEGNSGIASGDDIFLLEKFQKEGLKMAFLKSENAIVSTPAQFNLQSLLSQRKRWAAKTSSYKNNFGKSVGLLVLTMNLTVMVLFFMVLGRFLAPETLFLVFLIKFNVDFVLIYTCSRFFQREDILKSYLWGSVIYPFFSGYVALVSVFSGYNWKGRQFRK